MKRFDCTTREYTERADIDAFIEEILNVCKKHGFSISHEDGHGGFQIEDKDEGNFEWLCAAFDNTTEKRGPGTLIGTTLSAGTPRTDKVMEEIRDIEDSIQALKMLQRHAEELECGLRYFWIPETRS